MSADRSKNDRSLSWSTTTIVLSALSAVLYYFSNPKPQQYYDYTFRVADKLLSASVGLADTPPLWLNEFVPLDGIYYSVFPLGAVISMIPFALLRATGMITEMPGAFIAALLAGVACCFLLKISQKYDLAEGKKILITFAILFGTWMWTNLTFEGAWQLALGFAVVGELGALYFSMCDRRPLLAGAFFALAFGNRTEILLTAPIFFYLLNREPTNSKELPDRADGWNVRKMEVIKTLARFCVVPFVLGILTLVYNYARFHSFTDFGYSRIPGVLNEPWYDHGIFSLHYIPRQAMEMLWKPWHWKEAFPYLIPDGFSNSILWSSPFIVLLIRFGSRDRAVKYASWAAIAVLTFLLWIHGNSGGWQFSYRYAMILLPWAFVIILENSPKKITTAEWILYVFSFAMNLYATWLFHWTQYVKP